MSLKLEMPVVRELPSRRRFRQKGGPSVPAWGTGENTVEFLSACYRLLDALNARSSTGSCAGRRVHACERSPRWESRAFSAADRHESSSVSEAASVAGSAGTHAHRRLDATSAAFDVGYESATIQPRIQPSVWAPPDEGYSDLQSLFDRDEPTGRSAADQAVRATGLPDGASDGEVGWESGRTKPKMLTERELVWFGGCGLRFFVVQNCAKLCKIVQHFLF